MRSTYDNTFGPRAIFARRATTRKERMIGLIGRNPADRPLLIPFCNSVHTFGMSHPIDVIFLDGEYRVLQVVRNVQPWRFGPRHPEATHVLETFTETNDSDAAALGKVLSVGLALV